jgi:molybdopterin converting factor small subunit
VNVGQELIFLRVRYFAELKNIAQKQEELVDTKCSSTLELYRELREKYKWTLEAKDVRVSINDQFTDWRALLNDGDLVSFIPPPKV